MYTHHFSAFESYMLNIIFFILGEISNVLSVSWAIPFVCFLQGAPTFGFGVDTLIIRQKIIVKPSIYYFEYDANSFGRD